MRYVVNTFLLFKTLLILLYLRHRSKYILLIDFDFTLVNDHFDWEIRKYKSEQLMMDNSIIKIIKNNIQFTPVIFTARGLRSKKYIKEFTNWQNHFIAILNCGTTKNKIWIIQNYLGFLYENAIWVDDLRDVNFEKGGFNFYNIENIPENIELILWRK